MAHVYVVSGGMGASGEQLARTALAQFSDSDFVVAVVPRVRSKSEIQNVVERAAVSDGMIIHTLVEPCLREEMSNAARKHQVVEFDLMGPVLDLLAEKLRQKPLGKPGMYRKIREDYFRRIEAIEFAVRHDDGAHCHELDQADIVLTGVSRAGKTPLAMYLAMRGYKTANVPLIKGISPPKELFEIERGRVVGLMVEPERLVSYRRRRQQGLGSSASTIYSEPREVLQDLDNARQVIRQGRFATIDVTVKPIEESANEVVSLIPRPDPAR